MSVCGTKIDIIRGAEAETLLARDAFRAEWESLLAQCPWATAFQTPGYVLLWYRTYRSRYEPILALCRTDDGRLQGLLTLAICNSDGRLVVAGDYQSEYQVWVCPPELGDSFPLQVMEALRKQIPGADLSLHYLPPGTPTGWLSDPQAGRLCVLEVHRRPLLRFGDGQEMEDALRKGHNRSRFNHLQKLGSVEFKKITDPAELEACFAEIMAWHDVRHVAVNGSASFREDPLMKSFGLAMLSAPGLLHATALTVGGKLASVHLGACSRKEVELGLIALNPWLAKHSVGRFHVYYLAKMLMKEGYEQLDLTPGGGIHYYKERLANAGDEVHTLTVYPTRLKRRAGTVRASVKTGARKALDVLHLTPNQARLYAGYLRRLRPAAVPGWLRLAGAWLSSRQETRVYCHEAGDAPAIEIPAGVHRDCLEDLLAYQPGEVWLSRQAFMTEALERIEEGQHVYTCMEEGELLQWAWLIERPTAALRETMFPGFALPPNSALALGFGTAGPASGREGTMRCLQAMLRDVGSLGEVECLVVAIPADGDVPDTVLEEVGFCREGALVTRTRLGLRRQWSVCRGTRVAPMVSSRGG